jgi:exonuclease SbcD
MPLLKIRIQEVAMRLLLSGDLHIGRSSSRTPDSIRREDLRAVIAWSRIVDLAIYEQVRVVCLSGDVADQENKFWEAIGPLEQGIHRLGDAKIRTIAVAGNHDHDVLARLADQLPRKHFTLLGRGGKWERITIEHDGRVALHIDGWSFPRQRVSHSPLDSSSEPGTPILGMVHGDLDVANSPYAPLELARLQGLPPANWLLGHIHAHRLIGEGSGAWVLYPGSPQALDPSETGPHGAWLVEVTAGTISTPEHRPLSSVWYDRCEIDLSTASDESDIESLILDGIRDQATRVAGEAGPHLAHISLRLRLAGNTPVSHRVRDVAGQVIDDLSLPVGDASVGIEAVVVETVPAIDLAEHAKTHSAPGALARLLLELNQEEVSAEVAELIRRARRELEQVDRHKDFAMLKRRDVTDELARDYLQTQARELLTQVMTQTP